MTKICSGESGRLRVECFVIFCWGFELKVRTSKVHCPFQLTFWIQYIKCCHEVVLFLPPIIHTQTRIVQTKLIMKDRIRRSCACSNKNYSILSGSSANIRRKGEWKNEMIIARVQRKRIFNRRRAKINIHHPSPSRTQGNHMKKIVHQKIDKMNIKIINNHDNVQPWYSGIKTQLLSVAVLKSGHQCEGHSWSYAKCKFWELTSERRNSKCMNQ